jgi:hypothetical protein
MEEWLLRRNRWHLQQMYVEERPPTTPAFSGILSDHGTSHIADQLLSGDFDVTSLGMDVEMEEFLRHLKMTPEEKKLQIHSRLSREDFQRAMAVTDENTSSSASGIHYTLWKAIATQDELAEMHSLLLSLQFMYGFKCNRWLRSIDCMLEKKEKVRKIHVMRIICLFEADFNTALKWFFSKNVMPNAESTGLSEDQWGGRNNRSAPACAMRKLITWEYARYAKVVVTGFLGDLSSNFDCIMPDMTNILCRKKGMSKETAWTRAATMEGLERHVRTAAGTSTATYKNIAGEHPSGGEGQGKADSMAAWTLISSMMLTVHKKLCHGVELIDVTGKLKSRRSNDMYVDDNDGYASAPNTNTVAEAVDNMQHHAGIWAALVAATGGLMAFHKCHWQILAWIAVSGFYLMMTDRKIIGDLHLKDHKGKTFSIPRKNALLPNPGLGFLICPNADQSFEFKKRLTQVKECADRVRTAAITGPEAWLALITRVLPRITYPFGLTRFTKKQLHTMAIVLNNTFLPKLGTNRNMPRVVVYGPSELGGISYPCLETIQDQKGIS